MHIIFIRFLRHESTFQENYSSLITTYITHVIHKYKDPRPLLWPLYLVQYGPKTAPSLFLIFNSLYILFAYLLSVFLIAKSPHHRALGYAYGRGRLGKIVHDRQSWAINTPKSTTTSVIRHHKILLFSTQYTHRTREAIQYVCIWIRNLFICSPPQSLPPSPIFCEPCLRIIGV